MEYACHRRLPNISSDRQDRYTFAWIDECEACARLPDPGTNRGIHAATCSYGTGLTSNYRYCKLVPHYSLVQNLGKDVNKKQLVAYQRIFEKPTRSDVAWADIESLFAGLGATITEGSGSRARVALHGVKAVFHRPHPERVTDRGQVSSVRRFLEHAGHTL